jgi:hypothetical protein
MGSGKIDFRTVTEIVKQKLNSENEDNQKGKIRTYIKQNIKKSEP